MEQQTTTETEYGENEDIEVSHRIIDIISFNKLI